MTRTLLDPTHENAPAIRERLPRLASLEGATIGLLDISKARGDLFLDRLEARLREEAHRGAERTEERHVRERVEAREQQRLREGARVGRLEGA